MGPSVKFVSPNMGLISKKKKIGVHFFVRKNDQTGGGSEGGLAKDHTFSELFLTPFLTDFLGTKCSYSSNLFCPQPKKDWPNK